jgi:hypothetical protein
MRNFGKKSLDEMKDRLRMRGFLPPEEEGLDGFDAASDEYADVDETERDLDTDEADD